MNKDVSLVQQLALLKKEYEYEKQTFQHDTEMMGIDRKVKRGDCWFPITVGRSYYNSLDRFVVEIMRPSGTDIEHNFEYGRQVCFFSQDGAGLLHYLSFQATVSYAEADRMVVELPGEGALAQLQSLERAGVQLHFDDYSYRVMFDALHHVIEAKGNRLAALRDMFHSAAPVSWGVESAVPLRLPWLNASQEAAVRDVLRAKDVLIVHGPPGTGKTTTLVEAVSEVLRREPQVMVCAQSNTAVDWMCQQLADRGISVLRIGNPSRVTEAMLANTYEHRFESHPDYPDLWQVRRSIRQLYSLPRKGRGENFHQKIARLRERADELEMRIRHALFDQSRVIACTLTGAANQLLAGQHYHTLFIDEAAQALEAACWIPLQKADRVILAGDHQQLPPTVKCAEAMRGGLGRTLMEQVAHCKPEVVRLLRVQYRMNEALMRFSSEWFYHGQLEAAPEVRNRSLLDYIDDPLVWVDTDQAHLEGEAVQEADNEGVVLNHEQFVGSSYGRINKREAELTMQTLKAYVERMGRHRLLEERVDFGIISPYRAQVQYLRGLIKRDAYLRPLRAQITVNTVDAFQGQERDVVMVSLVRANEAGQIGFLSDLRRMNVAITRARYKLVILGSAQTLCKHTFYKKLFDSCQHV
ncbi:AAA domain-containing protein [Prevotellamassilia timonensis]|uniref:AAA domain-containing protein n=1 Tax=Prevotellamassilia timonensis TaxID=1852370 RepID=UPI003078A09B